MPKKQECREKLIDALDELRKEGLFVHNEIFEDLKFKQASYEKRPVYLIETLAVINCLVANGSMLFFGGHGGGKTTLAKFLGQIILGKNKGEIERSVLRGHPQLTEEKILGTLNIKQLLNRDKDEKIEVIWNDFVKSQWKIIDEVNRLSPYAQNIILSLLAEGIVKYYDVDYECDKYILFATMNPQDIGTTGDLPLPFLDRFGIAVPVTMPNYEGLKNIGLKDKKLIAPDIKIKGIFKNDIENVWKSISKFNINSDAELFIKQILSIFRLCVRINKEISEDLNVNNGLCTSNSQCRYKVPGHLCHKIKNPLSVRVKEDLERYSKALAWYLGDEEVTKEHIVSLSPYIIWHRTKFSNEYLSDKDIKNTDEENNRVYKNPLRAAKKIIEEINSRFTSRKHFYKLYEDFLDGILIKNEKNINIFAEAAKDDLCVNELYKILSKLDLQTIEQSKELKSKIQNAEKEEELKAILNNLNALYCLPNRIELISETKRKLDELTFANSKSISIVIIEEKFKKLLKGIEADLRILIIDTLGENFENKSMPQEHPFRYNKDKITIKFFRNKNGISVRVEVNGNLGCELAKRIKVLKKND